MQFLITLTTSKQAIQNIDMSVISGSHRGSACCEPQPHPASDHDCSTSTGSTNVCVTIVSSIFCWGFFFIKAPVVFYHLKLMNIRAVEENFSDSASNPSKWTQSQLAMEFLCVFQKVWLYPRLISQRQILNSLFLQRQRRKLNSRTSCTLALWLCYKGLCRQAVENSKFHRTFSTTDYKQHMKKKKM